MEKNILKRFNGQLIHEVMVGDTMLHDVRLRMENDESFVAFEKGGQIVMAASPEEVKKI